MQHIQAECQLQPPFSIQREIHRMNTGDGKSDGRNKESVRFLRKKKPKKQNP